jgi:hypothetical protein
MKVPYHRYLIYLITSGPDSPAQINSTLKRKNLNEVSLDTIRRYYRHCQDKINGKKITAIHSYFSLYKSSETESLEINFNEIHLSKWDKKTKETAKDLGIYDFMNLDRLGARKPSRRLQSLQKCEKVLGHRELFKVVAMSLTAGIPGDKIVVFAKRIADIGLNEDDITLFGELFWDASHMTSRDWDSFKTMLTRQGISYKDTRMIDLAVNGDREYISWFFSKDASTIKETTKKMASDLLEELYFCMMDEIEHQNLRGEEDEDLSLVISRYIKAFTNIVSMLPIIEDKGMDYSAEEIRDLIAQIKKTGAQDGLKKVPKLTMDTLPEIDKKE